MSDCPYCGGNCPNEPDNSEFLCDGFSGDIDGLSEELWTICTDSLCDGYSPVMDEDMKGNSKPCSYKTKAEANAELEDDPEFYEGCFVCKMSEIGHKTTFVG